MKISDIRPLASSLPLLALVACGGGGKGGLPAGPVRDAGGTPADPTEAMFDRERLHELVITVDAKDVPTLNTVSDRVPATITFDGITVRQAGVRNKGATSLRPASGKLSFSIKFDELVPGQRLLGMKKLIVNNEVQDPTWVTELYTYDTFRRAGLPASRVAHAVVTFNGVPKGIYNLIEPVNGQFLARHWGAARNDGNLYEGPWDFTDGPAKAELKDEVAEMRTRDDLAALVDAVVASADGELEARLAKLLDLDLFMTFFAAEVVTDAWDGYTWDAWNFYLYDVPGDGHFVFIPAGANWPYFVPDLDPFDIEADLWKDGTPGGYLCRRIRKVPALDARYRLALERVTRDSFDVAALRATFDQSKRVLHTTTRSDPATRSDLETFDANIARAHDFVERRRAFMRKTLGLP